MVSRTNGTCKDGMSQTIQNEVRVAKGNLWRFAALLVATISSFGFTVFAAPDIALAQFEAFHNCQESNSSGASFIGRRGFINHKIDGTGPGRWKLYYTLSRRTGVGRSLIVWTKPAYCVRRGSYKTGKIIESWQLRRWCPNGTGCEKYNDIKKW